MCLSMLARITSNITASLFNYNIAKIYQDLKSMK
jgi:hypothetical protein